tara:strand:- start:7476 stop:7946 length:471 start_codon:yes stop_codon:yes gene_type:complete
MKQKIINLGMLILLLPMLLFSGCSNGDGLGDDPDFIKAKKIIQANMDKYTDEEASGELIDGVRVIEVTAYQFYFEPTTIIVNQGEKIRIKFSSEDIPHGFEIHGYEIPGYDFNEPVRPGFPIEIEFEAKEQGIFEFICSIYCGFGHSAMKGLFVVR